MAMLYVKLHYMRHVIMRLNCNLTHVYACSMFTVDVLV